MVTNINKLGGVKSEILLHGFCGFKRFSALFSVPKAAIFVSLLCMGMALFGFTSCSEEESAPIENNLDTDTRINTLADTAESTDSTDTSHAVISDWEEGEAGDIVPMTEEEIERLLKELLGEGGAV